MLMCGRSRNRRPDSLWVSRVRSGGLHLPASMDDDGTSDSPFAIREATFVNISRLT